MRLGCTPYPHVIGLTRFAGLADHSRRTGASGGGRRDRWGPADLLTFA